MKIAIALAVALAVPVALPAAAEQIIIKGQSYLVTSTAKDGTCPCDFQMVPISGDQTASWRVSSDHVVAVSASGIAKDLYRGSDGHFHEGPKKTGDCPCDIRSDIRPDHLPVITWTMKTENGKKMKVVVGPTGFFSYSFPQPDGSVGEVIFHQASMLKK